MKKLRSFLDRLEPLFRTAADSSASTRCSKPSIRFFTRRPTWRAARRIFATRST